MDQPRQLDERNASSASASDAPRPSRRSFLQKSLGAAAAGSSLALAPSRGAHAAGSDVIRVGMIGSGSRCSGAALGAMKAGPDVRLVAMCDIFEGRLQSARESLTKLAGDQVAVDDEHAFLGFDGYQNVIDSCDAVLIACASKFHPMYAEAAIAAGKHVFVEKPHGIDPVGVRRMMRACDAAQDKGLSVVSGLHSRFHTGWQETIARIHEGAIGDIVSIESTFLRGPYRVYERPAELTETQYQFFNWYHFRWLSGDDVTQSLVHNLDRVSWIMQQQMPTKCFGLGGRSSSFGEQFGDMFDHHTAVFEYDSGTRVYALCRTQTGCYNKSTDVVQGTKGTCHLGQCKIEGETEWRYDGPRSNPYQAEQQAFIDSIRDGQPLNSGDTMNSSNMVAVLGQLACYGGRMLNWEDAANAEIQFGPAPEESSFDTTPPSVPDATGNYPLPHPGLSGVETL